MALAFLSWFKPFKIFIFYLPSYWKYYQLNFAKNISPFFLVIWQVRMESVESVNKILEEAHKRIQPNGTCK